MASKWVDSLEQHRGELSRRELDLIDYISAHPYEACSSLQSELCERAGVSKPVVISCFRRLGYETHQDFLDAIQAFYLGSTDSAKASVVALKDVGSLAELVDQALEVEMSTFQTLRSQLKAEELDRLARAVIAANRVYLYAEGTGFEPAHYLSQRLRRCGVEALLVGQDRAHLADDIGPVGEGDLCLTFFYTQDALIVARLFDEVRKKGGRCAVVTGFPDPELYSRSDFHVFVPRGRWNFKNSMAAPMAFAQILLLAVEFIGGEELQTHLKELEASRTRLASEK